MSDESAKHVSVQCKRVRMPADCERHSYSSEYILVAVHRQKKHMQLNNMQDCHAHQQNDALSCPRTSSMDSTPSCASSSLSYKMLTMFCTTRLRSYCAAMRSWYTRPKGTLRMFHMVDRVRARAPACEVYGMEVVKNE